MLTNLSFLLISHLFLFPSHLFLSLLTHFHLTAPPSPFIWTFPDPLLAAASVASGLVSPGIRDLRSAWSPVSPLIHSQVPRCTVNYLDCLTHHPKSVIMTYQGDSGCCSTLDLRLCPRPNVKYFLFFLSSANLVF